MVFHSPPLSIHHHFAVQTMIDNALQMRPKNIANHDQPWLYIYHYFALQTMFDSDLQLRLESTANMINNDFKL